MRFWFRKHEKVFPGISSLPTYLDFFFLISYHDKYDTKWLTQSVSLIRCVISTLCVYAEYLMNEWGSNLQVNPWYCHTVGIFSRGSKNYRMRNHSAKLPNHSAKIGMNDCELQMNFVPFLSPSIPFCIHHSFSFPFWAIC